MTESEKLQHTNDERDLANVIAQGASPPLAPEAFIDYPARCAVEAAQAILGEGKPVSVFAVQRWIASNRSQDTQAVTLHVLHREGTEPLAKLSGKVFLDEIRDRVLSAYRSRALEAVKTSGEKAGLDPAEIARNIIEADTATFQSGEIAITGAKPFLDLWSPSDCRAWTMPDDYLLAGEFHLTRGGISVIGGVPGCGKSRTLVGLGIAGATGSDWMGLPIHANFRTLIIQAENGPARLKGEFSDIPEPDGICLDDFVKISRPGPYGLPLHDPDFRQELRRHINNFQPGVVAFDPWNRLVLDDKQKDYRAAINWILECLPSATEEQPAIVIVAHLRKRATGDGRKRGRDLLAEISGSGMIGSAARSAFILEPASPDQEDDRVVWTCAKNNDGREGPSSAWHRRNGLFTPCEEFDLEEFFKGDETARVKIEAADVERAIGGGVPKKTLVARLQEETGCGQSAAYAAISPNGRFALHLDETPDGILIWNP